MTSAWSLQDVTVDGVSLKSLAFGLELDALDTTVRRRGENLPVAFRRGRVWRAKQLDEVTRNLYLWVDHASPTGIPAASRAARLAQLNANVRELQAILAAETAQITVQREVILPDGLGGTTTQTWTAYAEVVDAAQFVPVEDNDELRRIEVPLLFSDPLWYGPLKSASLTSGGNVYVDNDGEMEATWVSVNFEDGTDPKLTNNTGDNVWVQILRNIDTGDVVYVRRGYCYRVSDNANLIGYLRHSGARSFMRLLRGTNNLSLTGGGTATVYFREPHL
jgi:hypothetical protein